MTGKMGTPLRRRLSRLSSLPMLLPRITEAAMIADWTTWLVIVAAVLIFWCLRGSRIPVKHRWRRRQARLMCRPLQDRHRSQPTAVVLARLLIGRAAWWERGCQRGVVQVG